MRQKSRAYAAAYVVEEKASGTVQNGRSRTAAAQPVEPMTAPAAAPVEPVVVPEEPVEITAKAVEPSFIEFYDSKLNRLYINFEELSDADFESVPGILEKYGYVELYDYESQTKIEM